MKVLPNEVSSLIFVVAFVTIVSKVSSTFFKPFNVTYDHRALIIDGQRRTLISAGVHYPRSAPEMWPDLIQKSKDGGVDLIESYVFWNGHEPSKGQYNFEGRYDIVKFIKLVASSGLYLQLRIGPYVCAEWNFGGFPVWLRSVPGMKFRTNNEPFKEEMQRFVNKIVDLMKEEFLFSWQGGPIILLQIENEYGDIESAYGQSGKEYIKWAAKMALGLGAGVPWVMCKQTDASKDIIDTCNGYYCDGFKPNSRTKPILWTENWDGWYTKWGDSLPHRPAEDLAFAVARFFQRGGSFQNYYMYFGGTNFGRTSGGPFYITSYDYDAPIDEYGLISEPKWGHLKNLHAAIKLCESALINVDNPQYTKLGPKHEAHLYKSSSKNCCAFLANIDDKKAKIVTFNGRKYTLPPWSVSVLPDCRTVVFNTAKVTVQTSIKTATPVSTSGVVTSPEVSSETDASFLTFWEVIREPIGIWSEKSFTSNQIMEQLEVTEDNSDYLWHFTWIEVSEDDVDFWEKNMAKPAVAIDKMRDVLHVFVNNQLLGTTFGHWVKVYQPVNFTKGLNQLVLLSETVGLQNYGAFLEKDGGGFNGVTELIGFRNGIIDLSKLTWTYQVGLHGENKRYFSPHETEETDWSNLDFDSQPLTFSWYKSYFDAPKGMGPVGLDLGSMGKGQVWVNGHHLGRYWTLQSPKEGCHPCDYRGAYNARKCRTNCGMPTQTLYHVPRAWLQPTRNMLVLFEETGGNPFEISLKVRASRVLCADVSELDYPPLDFASETPMVKLRCDEGYLISAVDFASYGTPKGGCREFSAGTCHFVNSSSVVSDACLGRNRCNIAVSNTVFGDPCPRVVKSLAVQAKCDSFLVAGSAVY